tara:strand:+ start:1930 stop:2826 length:897 start_codon:yes stop_codon:yes gene_type:complete
MSENMTFLSRRENLSIKELYGISKVFVELGITKIRLTGGEPLVRSGILSLISSLSQLRGLEELTLTTNGALLKKLAKPLKDAGITRINISLDTLQRPKFRKLSRTGELDQVLDGIEAVQLANFKNTKINAVILAGYNDDEICDLADFAIERDFNISYIEEMPLGSITSHKREFTELSSTVIRKKLEARYKLTDTNFRTGGPSRYVSLENSKTKIGFISPISQNFCSSCNRVRLTSDGQLLSCLGNTASTDLKTIIRKHPKNLGVLKSALKTAIKNKPERHHFNLNRTDIVRFMNATGG